MPRNGIRLEVLTTGQVAKILRVAPRTVTKWCEENMILYHTIPGANHRRIEVSNLRLFMAAHKFPMHWLDEELKQHA